jgi:hypothetical protein
MPGKLKPSIVQDFENSFILNCLTLFGEAFLFIKENQSITIDWEEENISANFFDYIDKSEQAIIWNINIADEHRLYYNSILTGKKPAKTASRIDFRLSTNWIERRKRFEFFIETKNLIEIDCFKAGRKTKVSAQKLQERYIETGIDNFVSGKYPNKGCLVGYILQGMPESIVLMINSCLRNQNRLEEQLIKISNEIPYIDYSFKSFHERFELRHYLLQF